MDTYSLRNVPVILYTRMFYAISVLIQLHISIQSLDVQIQNIMDVESLGYESYLWRLITLLQAACGFENFRVPKVFLGMLERLSQWCFVKLRLQVQGSQFDDTEDELRIMDYTDALELLSNEFSINL